MKKPAIVELWQREFKGYNCSHLRSDLLAGLTVAAVGLITAIVSGLVIGALSGAPYQISGPTGAMAAVLIVIVQKYGLPGLWLASLMAGGIILALGLARLGRLMNVIP